jgi:hypothetical protein
LSATEEAARFKSTALTLTGGKSSSIEVKTSSTFRTERFLMLREAVIQKDKKFLSGTDTTEPTRDGESSILIKLERTEPRVTTTNGASISADHSTSDQDSQCKELPKLYLTILDSEDITFQERDNKLGNSIESPIPSSLTTPDHTQSTWQATTAIPTSELLLPTQDGGKCSE